MNKKDVKDRMELFLRYLREEQELRDQANALSYAPAPEKDVRKTMRQESEILKKIEALRQEKMLPILEELSKFVATQKAAMAKGGPASKAATPAASAAKPAAKPATPARR